MAANAMSSSIIWERKKQNPTKVRCINFKDDTRATARSPMEFVVHALEGLERAAEAWTPLKFQLFHALVNSLAATIHLEADKLRYMLALFAAFPLALVYRRLPTAKAKHTFDIIVGISIAQFVLGSAWIHSFLISTLSYVLVRFGPAQMAPYAVFALNMSYISLSHLYRIHVDYMGFTLDFTGPQMLLVLKLTSFAFNYFDGVVDNVFEKAREAMSPPVYTSRSQRALTKCPSLLEFYGFVYCFPAFLAGPAFEIREYLSTTNNSKFLFMGRIRKPSAMKAVLTKLTAGVALLVLYVVLSPQYPGSMVIDPELREHSMLYRFRILWIVQEIMKFKYYMAWKLAEGACVLCGFGFEGFNEDGSSRGWNGVNNMDIMGFELATSIRDITREWNKCTQAWLQRYVYERTNQSLVATYFISALWHGFYPGYYFFFLSLPLATEVSRLQFKRLRPWFYHPNQKSPMLRALYQIFSWVSTQMLAFYLVMAFPLLSWENALAGYANFEYAGHLAMIVLYVALPFVPLPNRKHLLTDDNKIL